MQQRRTLWPAVSRLLRNAALIDIGILSLAGLVCWTASWRTWFQHGKIVAMGGALCAIIGAVTKAGGAGSRDPDYLHVDSMGYCSRYEHTKQIALDTTPGSDSRS